MDKLILYSDGACSGNPGPGGYGAVIKFSDITKTYSRGFEYTTNNRMELMGVIEPLESIKEPHEIHIITDSKYVVDAINKKWLDGWTRRQWKTSSKKKAKNIDLWKRFLVLLDKHAITIEWVKGHNSHPQNDYCDQLAVKARLGQNLFKDEEYDKPEETEDDIFGM